VQPGQIASRASLWRMKRTQGEGGSTGTGWCVWEGDSRGRGLFLLRERHRRGRLRRRRKRERSQDKEAEGGMSHKSKGRNVGRLGWERVPQQ
jgi:hypothetical protein